MTHDQKCPLCAGKVLYAGLYVLDCATFGCNNGPKTDPMAGLVDELKRELMDYNWFPFPWTP